MRTSKAHRGCVAVGLLAWLLNDAAAQSSAPATVVISAPRPVILDGYRATEARIRDILARRPGLSSPSLSWCMENRFADENAAFPGHPVPVATPKSLDMHIKCARTHIEATDTTLKQGLEAFDKQHYAAALALFESAYARMGTQDAALMLAKMHIDGLGAPKDQPAGIEWLRKVAEDRFDPWFDTLRLDPKHPGAINARIEAALMLARIYEGGDGVQKDWTQAEAWHGKAVELGFIPAPDRSRAGQAPTDAAPLPGPTRVAAVTDMPAPDKPERPEPPADNPAPAAAGTQAQSQADPGVFMRVRVTGLRALPWKSYRAMRAAVTAYEKHKSLAPDAVLSFAAVPPAGTRLPPNFRLRVRTRAGKEYPIALQDGGLFQLPLLPGPEADADLVSNLKGGQLRIGLLLHSRGVPPEKERLGDVRLREAIDEAIADADKPNDLPWCRGRTHLHGECRPHATVWFRPRAPASGAWLVVGDRREALQDDGDAAYPAYRIPVNAGHLGNDAIIEFDYKAPLRPLKANAVLMSDAGD